MTEIQTPQAPTKLLRKLVEVRKAVPYLQKSQNGHQYAYVGSSNVLAVVREKLDEMCLVLFPEIISLSCSLNLLGSIPILVNPMLYLFMHKALIQIMKRA